MDTEKKIKTNDMRTQTHKNTVALEKDRRGARELALG